VIFFGCQDNKRINNQTDNTNPDKTELASSYENMIGFKVSPEGKIKVGDLVKITIELKDSIQPEEPVFFIENNPIQNITGFPFTYDWNTTACKVGKNRFHIEFKKQNNKYSKNNFVTLSSNIVPKIYSYKVINTYKHDKEAYTQGLLFDNGFLYEATGLKNSSSLRKVNLENGEVIQSYAVPNDIFGEGITLFQNKIIQLSWQDHVGYVYDKQTFKLLQQFNYPTEGWGITTINDTLVMSDGTSTLFYLDPNNFTELKRIEVFDDKGAVSNLNELEYINGEIFANIYTTDRVARIEPSTGKVLAYIDFSKILPESDKFPGIDVLNGIAFDAKNNRIFVTGKRWPKLFEIKIL
jgi:glutamine cyclotransferase